MDSRDSDLKAAEAARHLAEERYRLLVESIDAGFCVVEMILQQLL